MKNQKAPVEPASGTAWPIPSEPVLEKNQDTVAWNRPPFKQSTEGREEQNGGIVTLR